MKMKYDFQELYITAHSMGGLLARSFIGLYGGYFPQIKLLLTLSTPWGGVKMAEYGVKQSPAVIPCWRDIQPESPFIHSLYQSNIPEQIDFFLFYGHQGSRNPFRPNNDGTIAFSSLLDRRSQSEALMEYAFNEDHGSIITSDEVLRQYNTVINTYYEKGGASHNQTGGYLKINFSYDYPLGRDTFWNYLILRGGNKARDETIIKLSAGDSGKVIGPFAPGNYTASLIVETGKTLQQYVPVTVDRKKISSLAFKVIPAGVVSGYITSVEKPENYMAGMPNKRIAIRSITLEGVGIKRTIHPPDEAKVNLSDYFIQCTDHNYNHHFYFFDLPDGSYKITIRADGYHPFHAKCSIKAGQKGDPLYAALIPKGNGTIGILETTMQTKQ